MKKNINRLIILLALFINKDILLSQTISINTASISPTFSWTCGFNKQFENSIFNNSAKASEYQAYENSLAYKNGSPLPTPASAPYVIPVVFHIVDDAGAPSNISYNQILWQLAAMNAAFANNYTNMYNMSAGAHAVNTQISFCLAKNIPSGSAPGWSTPGEYGVMRYSTSNNNVLGQIVNDPTTQAALLSNTASFPFNEYLNIWVVPNICAGGPCSSSGAPTIIGYATFPSINPTFDGIVMRSDAIGDNTMPCNGFPMMSALNKGRILSHEIGHYLGLFHTFESMPTPGMTAGCYGQLSVANAQTEGDLIADTPPTDDLYQLPTTALYNSCGETYAPYLANYADPTANAFDQVENYMSYNDDDYMTTFTVDQRSRMWGALDGFYGSGIRQNLVTPTNLAYTGVTSAPSCGPGVTNVCFNYNFVGPSTCASSTIQFFAPSSPDIQVTYLWNFGDGTTSTSPSVLHTYSGVTNDIMVSLTVTNINTGVSVTTTQTIPFSQNLAAFSQNSNTSMCRGSEGSVTIKFGGVINQVTLSKNGVLQTINKPLNSDFYTVTDMLCVNTTYQLTNSCNGNNTITFNVVECGANLVNNGDFNLGNTGFTSDLCLGAGFGHYAIGTPAASIGGNITGNAMFIDGYAGGSTCLTNPISASCFGCPPADYRRNDFSQVINGLQGATQYYVQFKVSKSHYGFALHQIFLELTLTNGTTPLVTPSILALPYYYISPLSGSYEYAVYSYIVTTPPTITGTYELEINQIQSFFHYGFEYFLDNIEIRQMNTPVLQAAANPNPACAGDIVNLTATGDWSATDFVWSPGSAHGANINVTPPSNTLYTVTGNDNCQSQSSIMVTVNPLPVITAVASPASICPPTTTSSMLTASGGVTYAWSDPSGPMPGGNPVNVSPTANTTYNVTGTDANGCKNNANVTVTVQNCNPCTNCPNLLAPTPNFVLSSNPPANQVYCLTNNITISGNITISQSEVKISPNVVITVPANSVLNIVGSHLYSCTNMWQGIVIEPKGSVNILPYIVGNTTQKTSLIEDAEIAVDVQSSNGLTTNILTSDNATFNKNHYGIRIQGYTPNLVPYPFTVINSLFTCRNIPFTSNANTWPLTSTVKAATNPITSPLQTPYINNTTYSPSNANAFLKTPLAGQKSQTAIYLNKVGNTINPGTTPTYYEISIGTTGANNYNMFDNHLVALYGLNTNVKVVNSVFQNAITTGKAGTVGGIGIQVLSQEINNNRLQVVAANPAGIFFNKFFNCSRSILSQDYFENIIKNNDFRSTQINPAPATTLFQPGKYGITITSCRYRAVTVTSNKLYNIENPIAFSASVGFFNVGSGNNNGQYSGQVNINSNTIRQHLAGNTVTSQYVNLGIAISNIVSISNLVLIPGKTVNANSNSIDGAYRGIGSQNWFKKDVSTNNNTIRIAVQVATGTPLQYGIGSSNNTPASQNNINGNVITGFNTTYNRLHGIYTSLSTGQTVNCNSTTNTYNGLTFNGNSAPTKTAYNTMGNHHYGFVLDNTGVIGQQGTPTAPCDNTYTGPFVFKTATLNTSFGSSSPMYVRATGATNPNGSGFSSSGPSGLYDISTTGSLFYVGGNPPFIGCSTNNGNPNNSNNGNGNGNGNGNNAAIPVSDQLILEKIVQDQLPLASSPSQTEKINKHQVYRLLKSNPDLMTGSTVLQDFYTNSQPTLRETFVSIETDLSQGDITTGANKVAFIAPQDNIETNYKNFYEAYIKQSTDSLNATDSLQLATIASGCPFTDGAVVYQARALYNVVYNSAVTFEDNCPTIAANSRLGKEQNNTAVIDKDGFDALVYPNPSNGNIFVAPMGKDIENIVITVTDITGKILYNEPVTLTASFVNFNLNVKAGTYFVTIVNTYTNEKIIKKLIIQ